MAESVVTVTPDDIDRLARKIDELSEVLTDKERQLLLAVFQLAGASVAAKIRGGKAGSTGSGSETESGSGRAPVAPSVPALSSGFRSTFNAVGSSAFTLNRGGIDEVAGGVGIGVIW